MGSFNKLINIYIAVFILFTGSVYLYPGTGTALLPGEWIGSHTCEGIDVYWDNLTITKKGNDFTTTIVVRSGISQKEQDDFLTKNILSTRMHNRSWWKIMLFRMEMNIRISGDTLILTPLSVTGLNDKSGIKPVFFELKLAADNTLSGQSVLLVHKDGYWNKSKPLNLKDFVPDEKTRKSVVFKKKGITYTRPAFTVPRGKTSVVECLLSKEITYSCYIPSSYDPEKAVPIIINDAPNGNAKPFSLKAAEELGWISIGLPGQWDATGFFVIRDLFKRFRVAPKGLYFTGFSDTDGKSNAFAHSVYVYKNDVYIAGSILNAATGIMKAVYWKNGKMVPLSDGRNYTIATSIFVSNNNIIVAGSSAYNGTKPVATAFYWKNNKLIPVPGDYGTSVANSVFISGPDIYTFGYDGGLATWWKNGNPTHVKNPGTALQAKTFFVLGSDVYIAGKAGDSKTGDERPAWWLDGKITVIPSSGGSFLPSVNAIYVVGE